MTETPEEERLLSNGGRPSTATLPRIPVPGRILVMEVVSIIGGEAIPSPKTLDQTMSFRVTTARIHC